MKELQSFPVQQDRVLRFNNAVGSAGQYFSRPAFLLNITPLIEDRCCQAWKKP